MTVFKRLTYIMTQFSVLLYVYLYSQLITGMHISIIHLILVLMRLQSIHMTAFTAPKNRIKTKNGSYLVELLTGKFSNWKQARVDSFKGKDTAQKGGHEFITVNINHHPLYDGNVLIAQYCYGNEFSRTFRFRLYEFNLPNTSESCLIKTEKMKIYRPNENCEKRLKCCEYDLKHFTPNLFDCNYLPECDINWVPVFAGGEFLNQYKGELVQKCCEIPSQFDPGTILIVHDELIITNNRLFINDRIYTKETGKLIIGNQIFLRTIIFINLCLTHHREQ